MFNDADHALIMRPSSFIVTIDVEGTPREISSKKIHAGDGQESEVGIISPHTMAAFRITGFLSLSAQEQDDLRIGDQYYGEAHLMFGTGKDWVKASETHEESAP